MALNIEERERAEKERSAREASRAQLAKLKGSKKQIARYLAPQADTSYPLEYSFHILGDVTNKVILEYGCGDGENTLMLAQRHAHVIGLDLSLELIKQARKRLDINKHTSSVDLVVASAHEIPLPDESVDVVFGIAILHHLDLKISAREVRRVLKHGGRGIFQEPVRNSKLLDTLRKMFPSSAPDISPFERPLSDQELQDFALGCRYESKSFQLPTSRLFAKLRPIWTSRFERMCYGLDAALLDRFPSLQYYASVKVIEVTKP